MTYWLIGFAVVLIPATAFGQPFVVPGVPPLSSRRSRSDCQEERSSDGCDAVCGLVGPCPDENESGV